MQIIPVEQITRGEVDDDGSVVRVRFAQSGGGETEIAFPAAMMQPLILLASHLQGQAREKRGEAQTSIDYIPADSWGMSRFADGRILMFMNLPGGGTVSFALPPKSLDQMVNLVEGLKAQAEERPEDVTYN